MKCDVFRDVLPFVQFKKRENTYGGVPLLEAFNFTKINTPPWVFFTVLNCTNRIKHQKYLPWQCLTSCKSQ